MNLQSLIEDLANRADDLLSDARNKAEAQTMLQELLASDYPKLELSDRRKVGTSVIAILAEEGFFESSSSRDWDEGADEDQDE